MHRKNIILQNCNTLELNDLVRIVESGDISIDEFRQAGLDLEKLSQIVNAIVAAKVSEIGKSEKTELIERVITKKVSADEIKVNINGNKFSFEDLVTAGISTKTINSLKHYCSSDRVIKFTNVSDLPQMESGRTDIYFVGMPSSGKSTILSGMLNVAHKKGISMPDTYCIAGNQYQTRLITDLNKGVLPNATASGSYNYIALSYKDGTGLKHPFNIVEVPGELYKNMIENPNVSELLTYINNGNKKILIFVIDSLAHDTGYSSSANQDDQSLVYVNILNMFMRGGILEKTDAIYLVVNKFDAIKETRYPFDNRPDEEVALDFLLSEFKGLTENCKDAKDSINNQFVIRVLPFSIGGISYVSIIDHLKNEYASVLIDCLIADSFVVKGSRWTKIFK